MTIDSLFQECWADLPFLRKTLCGKDNARQMFIDTLQEWDSNSLAACVTDYQVEMYGDSLRKRVERRGSERYGFVILTVILVAVASAIISWLIHRWLDNTFPKPAFEELVRSVRV